MNEEIGIVFEPIETGRAHVEARGIELDAGQVVSRSYKFATRASSRASGE